MENNPGIENIHDVELSATQHATFICHMTGIILDSIAATHEKSGDATLNDIRVLNQLAQCTFKGTQCSTTDLARVLNMKVSTVSRIVNYYVDMGTLEEHRDPLDRRRRYFRYSADAIAATYRWADMVTEKRREASKMDFAPPMSDYKIRRETAAP